MLTNLTCLLIPVPLQACSLGYSKELSARVVLLAVYIELQTGKLVSYSLYEDNYIIILRKRNLVYEITRVYDW